MNEERKTLGEMTEAEIGALVRAKNEGKVIEVWDSVKCGWASAPDPGWYARVPYRISPEPKRETVTLYGCVTDEVWGRGTTGYDTRYDTHRITFDLIGGKPDCDSIKMEPL